eukprot:gene6578-3230_t
MSTRNSNPDWRSTLSEYIDTTDGNLRSSRRDVGSPRMHRHDSGVLQQRSIPMRSSGDFGGGYYNNNGGSTMGSAKNELGSLLTAVQGSLAELRDEVSQAKRLSSTTSAAVSEAGRKPSITSAFNEEIVRVIEERMTVLGQSIEQRMTKAVSAAQTRSTQQGPHSIAPTPREFSPHASRAALDAREGTGDGGGGAGGASDKWQVNPRDPPASETLVMLSISKSESAEKAAAATRSAVVDLEQRVERDTAQVSKRIASFSETGHAHWERIGQLSAKVEAMAAQVQKSETRHSHWEHNGQLSAKIESMAAQVHKSGARSPDPQPHRSSREPTRAPAQPEPDPKPPQQPEPEPAAPQQAEPTPQPPQEQELEPADPQQQEPGQQPPAAAEPDPQTPHQPYP